MEEDVKSDVIMLLGLTEPTAAQDKIIDFLVLTDSTIEAVSSVLPFGNSHREYCPD